MSTHRSTAASTGTGRHRPAPGSGARSSCRPPLRRSSSQAGTSRRSRCLRTAGRRRRRRPGRRPRQGHASSWRGTRCCPAARRHRPLRRQANKQTNNTPMNRAWWSGMAAPPAPQARWHAAGTVHERRRPCRRSRRSWGSGRRHFGRHCSICRSYHSQYAAAPSRTSRRPRAVAHAPQGACMPCPGRTNARPRARRKLDPQTKLRTKRSGPNPTPALTQARPRCARRVSP